MNKENITKIDNELGVEIEAHQITLYDVRAYSSQPITTLTRDQFYNTVELMIEGHCPACGCTLKQSNLVVCGNCIVQAITARHIGGSNDPQS